MLVGTPKKKFPLELQRNFGKIAGGISKQLLEELWSNIQINSGGTSVEILEYFPSNSEVFPGGSLKEFSEKPLRNSWRNPGRIPSGTSKECLEELPRNFWKNHEENLRKLQMELRKPFLKELWTDSWRTSGKRILEEGRIRWKNSGAISKGTAKVFL